MKDRRDVEIKRIRGGGGRVKFGVARKRNVKSPVNAVSFWEEIGKQQDCTRLLHGESPWREIRDLWAGC